MLGRVASLALRAASAAWTQGASASSSLHASPAAAQALAGSMSEFVRRSFATNSTDIFNTHRDTPDNNPNTPFEISPVREAWPPCMKSRAYHAHNKACLLITAWSRHLA